jgi:hypothetical protein
VLEWMNHEWPFVKKHDQSGNLPILQADSTAQGVVWLTISSAADKHFSDALDAVIAGGEVKNAKNKPSGCGVKY